MTHANFKRPVFVAAHLVFAIDYSTVQKCAQVYSTGGVVMPVLESVDDVKRLLEEALGPKEKEENGKE
ncbi:MAG TPA: hypothetical protein VM095_08495 [Pyrinomonadaceae bacterium]|nr:hypothetical protein [Pyrinomonadaceae bacterium]